MKSSTSLLLAFAFTVATPSAPAANIVFVSDFNDPPVAAEANTFSGFFPAGTGYTDSGFVALLQGAGHNVIRFNQPNAAGTLLTQPQIDALNTNDLIIISRNVGSGAFQPGQGDQWNNDITAPIIDMSPYHVRTGSSRLGWFEGAEAADTIPSNLSAVLTGNPVTDAATDYIFSGELMQGTNTALLYDELLDRNTSQIAGAPVAGGVLYAIATRGLDSGAVGTVVANVIAGFPSGTSVRAGANTLGGYRMFFSGGSRESAVQPARIQDYAGRETLTPMGERVFLRAVEVAINDGAAPASNPSAPIVFTQQPANITMLQNGTVSFSAVVTGAAPRTLQWQRDTGDGVTFTNIPDASTPLTGTSITLSNLTTADNNARFRVEASNAQGAVVSSVATLTITPDTAAPVPLFAHTFDGMNVVICFDELLDLTSAEEEFTYTVDGAPPQMATLRPDGQTVDLVLAQAVSGATFPVVITFLSDRIGNSINTPAQLTGVRYGLASTPVGGVTPVGTVSSCASNVFVVTAGGIDLGAGTDTFHFLHRTASGDFDARVRVASLEPGTRLETTSKAILTARATADATAAAVNVFITPSYPADDNVIASARPANGSTTTNTVGGAAGNGLPNAWLRITRVGDVFTTYRSVNGSTWVELGSTTVALGPTAEVGMGVVSHRSGQTVTATFTDFTVTAPGAAQPQIVNSAYNGSAFTASFDTQAGTTYIVEYNNDLNTSNWQTLATVTGDGNPYTINDAGPLPATRFYRVRVQ